MKQRILAVLSGRDERLVIGAMVLLVVLIAFEGWQFVLKTPFTKYRQVRENRVALASAIAAAPRGAPELAALAAEVQEVVRRLDAELQVPHSDDQLAAVLITELDRSAAENGVRLKAVKPGPRGTVGLFEEISYEVAAEGKYVALCRWLIQLENAVGGRAAVHSFALKTEADHVWATLRLALYRSADKAPRK
jgi:Tfp pilus assembly protein PilO